MQKRSWLLRSGIVIVLACVATPLFAEDKIQAFVNPNGRVVFTNLVDNAPAPITPVLPVTTDVLASEMPAPLKALVDNIATTHGVDPALVRAVMKTESNFNRYAVSRKGALGLMQLIPTTGRRYGVRDFFDPQQNVEGGVRYLKFLLEKFKGNLDLSLAAYNAGENLVERLGRIPPIPETTNYVRKIRAIYKKSPAAPSPVMIADETPRIYRSTDESGVIHFSNLGPAN
jgi:soluble lytic murein transglycosylase-like protein